MVFRIPFSWEKGVIIWKWQSYSVSLWTCWLWSLGRLVLFLSFHQFVCFPCGCLYIHNCLWLSYAEHDYYVLRFIPTWKLFENVWNEGEKHSHHLRNSHSRALKSFLSDLPSLPRKGIVAVTAKRRVLQQGNHMGCKIKISITGEKSRQWRSVCAVLLFSSCLLEIMAHALSFLMWHCKMVNA